MPESDAPKDGEDSKGEEGEAEESFRMEQKERERCRGAFLISSPEEEEVSQETRLREQFKESPREIGRNCKNSHNAQVGELLPVSTKCGNYPCDTDGGVDEAIGNLRENGEAETYPCKGTEEGTCRFPLKDEKTEEEEEEPRHFPEDGLASIHEGRKADEERTRPSCRIPPHNVACEKIGTERRHIQEIHHRESCSSYGESKELDSECNGEEERWANTKDVWIGPCVVEDRKDVPFPMRNFPCDDHEETVIGPCSREGTELTEEEECCEQQESAFGPPCAEIQEHPPILSGLVLVSCERNTVVCVWRSAAEWSLRYCEGHLGDRG